MYWPSVRPGRTSLHVRPAENTTKHKRPFVFGGAIEEGKQESEKQNFPSPHFSKESNVEFHEVKNAWIMGEEEGGMKRAEFEEIIKKNYNNANNKQCTVVIIIIVLHLTRTFFIWSIIT